MRRLALTALLSASCVPPQFVSPDNKDTRVVVETVETIPADTGHDSGGSGVIEGGEDSAVETGPDFSECEYDYTTAEDNTGGCLIRSCPGEEDVCTPLRQSLRFQIAESSNPDISDEHVTNLNQNAIDEINPVLEDLGSPITLEQGDPLAVDCDEIAATDSYEIEDGQVIVCAVSPEGWEAHFDGSDSLSITRIYVSDGAIKGGIQFVGPRIALCNEPGTFAHETGHSLGLAHADDPHSTTVMYKDCSEERDAEFGELEISHLRSVLY